MMESDIKDALIEKLLAWERGEVGAQDVHEWAEQVLDDEGWRDYPREDPRSIVMEVLDHLEALNHQLVTPADIPAILNFLAAKPGKEAEAWDRWEEYWESVDFEKRKQDLSKDPYYCT